MGRKRCIHWYIPRSQIGEEVQVESAGIVITGYSTGLPPAVTYRMGVESGL